MTDLYYLGAFVIFGLSSSSLNTRLASILMGLHILAGPFIRNVLGLPFFEFNSVWDLLLIPYCLLVEDVSKKIILVLLAALSFYINVYNIIFWDVDNLFIYNYYTQINITIIEIILLVVASSIKGWRRQLFVFATTTTLFMVTRL